MVFDNNDIPIATLSADKVHHPVGCCLDEGALWGSIVDPVMVAPVAMVRVTALAKCGANTSKFYGVAYKRTLYAVTLKVIITTTTIGIVKPHRLVRFAVTFVLNG